MLLNLIAIVSLCVGILFLSSARLGLRHADEFERYKMKSPDHMRRWGWLLLIGGIAVCCLSGILFSM